MMQTITSIEITGSAVITPAGTGLTPLRELLASGSDALESLPHDILQSEGLRWGKCNGFKVSDYMSPMKARKMDRCSQLAVSVAGLALADAGINVKEIAPERIGIVLGSGFCGVSNSAEFLTGYFKDGVEGLIPMIFPNTVPNAPASNASIEHGLKGPNATLVQRFCSAESAIMMGCRFLEEGRADIILAGGTDELTPLIVKGFKSLGHLKPSTPPYGEGCGIVVLENSAHAARRKARVQARIESIATIGMLAPGCEKEGFDHLLQGIGDGTLVSFSGSASDLPQFRNQSAGSTYFDTGQITGRSIAMGGTSLALLCSLLKPAQRGLHLAASPQGPYYAICVSGGESVQP